VAIQSTPLDNLEVTVPVRGPCSGHRAKPRGDRPGMVVCHCHGGVVIGKYRTTSAMTTKTLRPLGPRTLRPLGPGRKLQRQEHIRARCRNRGWRPIAYAITLKRRSPWTRDRREPVLRTHPPGGVLPQGCSARVCSGACCACRLYTLTHVCTRCVHLGTKRISANPNAFPRVVLYIFLTQDAVC